MKYTWVAIPEEIVVYKFLQIELVINDIDDNHFHPTAKTNFAISTCTEKFNFSICEMWYAEWFWAVQIQTNFIKWFTLILLQEQAWDD